MHRTAQNVLPVAIWWSVLRRFREHGCMFCARATRITHNFFPLKEFKYMFTYDIGGQIEIYSALPTAPLHHGCTDTPMDITIE